MLLAWAGRASATLGTALAGVSGAGTGAVGWAGATGAGTVDWLPEAVEGISDLTVTRPAFHHSTIPPLARASKLIPLTPTLYVVTRQTIPPAANEEWPTRT